MIIRQGYKTIEEFLERDTKEVLFDFTRITTEGKSFTHHTLIDKKDFEMLIKNLDFLTHNNLKELLP